MVRGEMMLQTAVKHNTWLYLESYMTRIEHFFVAQRMIFVSLFLAQLFAFGTTVTLQLMSNTMFG